MVNTMTEPNKNTKKNSNDFLVQNFAISDALIRTKTIFSEPTSPEYITSFLDFDRCPKKFPTFSKK